MQVREFPTDKAMRRIPQYLRAELSMRYSSDMLYDPMINCLPIHCTTNLSVDRSGPHGITSISREVFVWFHDVSMIPGASPDTGHGSWVSLGPMGVQQMALDSVGEGSDRYFPFLPLTLFLPPSPITNAYVLFMSQHSFLRP